MSDYSFCLVLTVNSGSLEPFAWNSFHRGDMGVSKCCSLDCNFLLDPTPRRPLPVFSLYVTSLLPSSCPILSQCDNSNPQIWCYTFAITVEIRISSLYGLWWILCIKRKEVGWRSFIVFSCKNKIIHWSNLPPCETMGEDRHRWAWTLFFLPPKEDQEKISRVRVQLYNVLSPLCCVNSLQSLVLLGAQAGDGGRNTAHAFLFFNLVVKVSYFVQLQSWSLKEGKPSC